MKLYHGTTAAVAKRALVEGLLPRQTSGAKTNRGTSFASNPNTVYITDIYAPYFAASAVGEVDWGILEIDTNLLEQKSILPDEDWLEQATRELKLLKGWSRAKTIAGRTRWFRKNAWQFSHLWKRSVEELGTCGYLGPIHPGAITKAITFDPASNRVITGLALDPTITIINHTMCADKYRALTCWLMGKDVVVDDIFAWAPGTPDERKADAIVQLENRSGWRLLYARERDGL